MMAPHENFLGLGISVQAKSESRNPKLETNPNDRISEIQNEFRVLSNSAQGIWISIFDISSDFMLRIGDFR